MNLKNGLYNHKTKEEFLMTMENLEVRALIEHLFRQSKSTEVLYGKDLYSFSLKQVEDVMRNINPATRNSAINSKSRINRYIAWGIENGRRANNLNPLHSTSNEWIDQFIDKTVRLFLSDTDIYDLVEALENAQDKALIQCIFEGISGKGMSELISMQNRKINWEDRIITVTDSKDNQERQVKVSERCIRFVRQAYEEESYVSEKTENTIPLIRYGDYILKNTQGRNVKEDSVSTHNLVKRLYIIKEMFDLERLSVTTIKDSGAIKIASELFKERGKIDKDEFNIIGEQFNFTKHKVRGYTYHNTTRMKNSINSHSLKTLYNIDVEI